MVARRPRANARPLEEESALRVPRIEAQQKIDERIELGRRLLDRQTSNWDEVNDLRSEYYTWNEYEKVRGNAGRSRA